MRVTKSDGTIVDLGSVDKDELFNYLVEIQNQNLVLMDVMATIYEEMIMKEVV